MSKTLRSEPPMQGRSTRQKRAMWSALASSEFFISATQLHRLLEERGEHVALATVYRILQRLHEAGEVDSLLNPDDGETLYRLCRTSEEHHHLVCRDCGSATELPAPSIDRIVTDAATRHGFTDVRYSFEIFGRCRDCQQPASAT